MKKPKPPSLHYVTEGKKPNQDKKSEMITKYTITIKKWVQSKYKGETYTVSVVDEMITLGQLKKLLAEVKAESIPNAISKDGKPYQRIP